MSIGRADFIRGAASGLLGCGQRGSRSLGSALAGETVYNVRDFGARGDGVSDDGPSIQAAIDAVPSNAGTLGGAPFAQGGIVYVPAAPRPYVVGSSLRIPKGLVLTGDGPGSMLYLGDGVNQSLLQIVHGPDVWVVLSWLTLEGNRFRQSEPAAHGIVVDAGQDLARYHDLFLGLYVRNFRGNGFEFVQGAPHRIVNCTFHDNGNCQIHHGPAAIDNYIENTVVGTDATEPESTGWQCEGSNNTWMGGAAARNSVGMLVSGLRNAVVGGTSVDSNGREGVILRANETRIVGAMFRNNSASRHGAHDDILIDGSGGKGLRNLISGCIIDGAHLETEPGTPQARHGVSEMNGATENVVSGCIVTHHVDTEVEFITPRSRLEQGGR